MNRDSPAIACAQLAMRRVAALTRFDLDRGINGLATVGSLAALLGLLMTELGILFSFRGTVGERSHIAASTFFGLAESLIPTAASLALAIFAFALRRNLQTRAESLALEMDLASGALLACLRPLEKLRLRRDDSSG
jgi:biopolymer transport protein ExbB/TolQ